MVINKQRLATPVVRQFQNPTGLGGHMAGWVMGHRTSNVKRSRWAVELLEVVPTGRVLELGCGPGVAIAFAARATDGLVVGVDRSEVMIGQARRRNARAVREGRVRLFASAVEDLPAPGTLPPFDAPFDAALAINTVGFWSEPVTRVAQIRDHLAPGGRIALVSQPRIPGATASTSFAAADELAELLAASGYTGRRVETLALSPPAVCVIASK